MGLFDSILGAGSKLLGSVGSVAKMATKIPGIGMIPLVGTALSAVSAGTSLYEAFGPKSSPGLMDPGAGGGGGLPALPGIASGFAPPAGGGHIGAPITTSALMPMPGGGSSLKTVHVNPQFPQDKATLDSWIAAGLLVPFNQLHSAYRAPKGFRVVHVNGVTMAVRSDVARRMKLVKPTHKPPISVGEWHALKKAHRTVKKVHKVHGLIKYVTDHTTVHGQVKIAHHKKAHHRKAA